jgi:alkanesulfonate monooxygenase SsuD/methylene tetrahydromethanopterin reductase-like flavin-dependent oxidoreductase (luciferase family)
MQSNTLRFGPLVTNPVTRHPTVMASTMATLNEISNGRAILGLGRGDSAVRTLGLTPMRVEAFRTVSQQMQALCRGETVTMHDTPVHFPWLTRPVPLFIAAYGPRMLQLAGEIADGVILQIAEPAVVEWSLRSVRQGAAQAGRESPPPEIVIAAPSYISADPVHTLSRVCAFPAVVSNHVRDLLRQYPDSSLPATLLKDIDVVQDYDYQQHGQPDAPHARAVSYDLAARFTIIGTIADCRAKIARLAACGATQICLYLNVVEEEHQLDFLATYGREIIPAFAGEDN